MKIPSLALAAAIALASGASTGASAQGGPTREGLVRQIVARWSGHVDRHYGIGAEAWATEMAPAFADASLQELRAAAAADDFEDMNTLVLGMVPRDATHALGDETADLVYIPVTPCRLFDTRVAGGAIAAGTVRDFGVTDLPSYAFQGGDAGDCGVGLDGSVAAAVVNFTAVRPDAAGYLTAFPFQAPQPLASSLNYEAGAIVGNEIAVRLGPGTASSGFAVFSYARTHLVGDIVGYYAAPRATALDCVEMTSETRTVEAGGRLGVSSPSCAAGYVITGGSCSSTTWDANIVVSRIQGDQQFCAYRNDGAVSINIRAYARCCRVPGR